MKLLLTIAVTFFAGMGAGLGTGFAGMSAAAVISPMLITFLGMDPYMAVGIALSSDVLASAASAYTYYRNKNLDVKNGLIMMVSVLACTVVGSYVASLVPPATMGNFSVFMTFLLGVKFIVRPVMTTKEAMLQVSAKKRAIQSVICGDAHRLYLRLRGGRRRHDDASDSHQRAGLRAENRRGHQRVYHDLYRPHRRYLPFHDRRHAGLAGVGAVRGVHPAVGADCRRVSPTKPPPRP